MDNKINPLEIFDNYDEKIGAGLDQFKTLMRSSAQNQLSKLRESGGDLVGGITNAVGSTADAFGRFLKNKAPVTQAFGNRNAIEKFSGGVNYGTDFGTPVGTEVNLPQGNWKVLQAFTGAKGGRLGDATNSGYGNSVYVQNADTGEKLRFSHLSDVRAKAGQQLQGGIIGRTGATGNVTGPHLDLEYYDAMGRLADVLSSKYGGYLK